MPYISHDRFHDYFDKFNVSELKEYMRNLLIALKHVHSFNVIHRDVKPSNFLHDRKNHKYLLVDFGLAQALNKEFDSTKCKENTKNNNEPNEVSQCDKKKEKADESIDGCETVDDVAMPSNLNNTKDNEDSKGKRKAPDSDETENKCSGIDSNPSKRQRTQTGIQLNNVIESGEIASQQQHQRTPYIPSQFTKTPLKEISTQKNTKQSDIELNASLTADVKSTILSFSINAKIQNQRDSNSMLHTPKISPLLRNAAIIDRSSATSSAHKYNLDNRNSGQNVKCYCSGRPTVCNVCLVKREIQATRAGTPGYRPTEVLLKYPNQTTAVDMWAVGTILISILSGCYPFFQGKDDYTALAEIITVFGDEIVKKTAYALGRHVCISRKKKALHLRKLCIRLRNRCKIQNTQFNDNNTISTNLMQHCDNCEQQFINCLCQHTDYNMDFSNDIYPDSVYDLLTKLLAINPYNRISAKDALEHPFFQETY